MDKKKNNILNTIIAGRDLTKLDLKTKTGYSYTTIIKAVDELCQAGLITCGTREVKSGKAPSVINYNPEACVLGLGIIEDKLIAVNADLRGEIRHFLEIGAPEPTTACIEAIKKLTRTNPPAMVGITDEMQAVNMKAVQSAEGVDCVRYSRAEGLASFYRIYAIRNNADICVIYIDEKITVTLVGETETSLDVGSLYSPIMHARTGRMTYNEVLAEGNVRQRLSQRFGAELCALEAAADESIFLYRERLELATAELCELADKMLKPSAIIVGGSYIGETVLQKIKEKNINSSIYFAGNAEIAVAQCAAAAALNELRL